MVLLLDGTPALTLHPIGEAANATLGAEVAALIKSGLSEKDALKQAAKSRGLSKSEAYREWQRKKR
jgi:16S rRNA (cytidine1402-2'-O)-methyltransferase